MLSYDVYTSPIGDIYVVVSDKGVYCLELFPEHWDNFLKKHPDIKQDKEMCREAVKQLDEYFSGKRKEFDLPLDINGTEFQRKVWNVLALVPYGKTCSYSDIAVKSGKPKAVRAIGGAMRANNIPIILPCHRVLGKSGKLVGYAGDKVDTKQWLLNHENKYM